MKMRIMGIILISTLVLGGCRMEASDHYLEFKDGLTGGVSSVNQLLSENEFFAKNLVLISEKDNSGEDSNLTSGATLLVNTTNHKLIYADNVYDKLYPASLTKLMTALVVLKYGELTDQVTISYDASHITESGARLCGFAQGDVLSLEALLNCLLVYSGNDAAVAIADHISGSEEAFAKKMNEEAKRIGAIHSNFINSSGLHDDNHYTTAYDIYLIFNELTQYDTFLSIINTSSYTANYKNFNGEELKKTFHASNQYLIGEIAPPDGISVIGGKTGTTSKAGNCLVLLSKNTKKEKYISVILKAENSDMLYSQMSYLLDIAAIE